MHMIQEEIFEILLNYHEDLVNEINGFKDCLKRDYIIKFSKKLDKYYKLSFDEFLIEKRKK